VVPTTPASVEAFDAETNQALAEQFIGDGCLLVPGVLRPEETDALRERVDAAFANPLVEKPFNDWNVLRLFEQDRMFRDLLVREPIISLVEAVVGADCHLIANNCIRNPPGKGFHAFHVDPCVWLPLPDEIPRFDPRFRFPCFIVHVQIALTDIETVEHGPTQYVPQSHYSGRPPNDPENPTFEDQGPRSVLCKAGDAYLQHPQAWHRGAPNRSDRTRYLMQQVFGQCFVSQRFYPYLNYRMPDHVLEGADERMLRILGKHRRGAYG
jgi:ectoine hydroxylase-related dioxygenase (phytanoyl-CoA dioxygenase family)